MMPEDDGQPDDLPSGSSEDERKQAELPVAEPATQTTANISSAVAPAQPQQISIQSLLKGLVKHKASDLHVKAGRPPLYRINGRLLPAKMPSLSVDDVTRLAYSTMTQKQIHEVEEKLQIDFGYLVLGLARFRANVLMQKGTLAFVIRGVQL